MKSTLMLVLTSLLFSGCEKAAVRMPSAVESVAIQTSERSGMVNNMMREEAAKRGFSGDSIKLDFRAPHTVVMRLYMIVGGKAELVRASKPTPPSKSFEIGFLFRPGKDKGRELGFIFNDHDSPGKEYGWDIPIEKAKPHQMPARHSYSLSSMGHAGKLGETVVYLESEKVVEVRDSFELIAKEVGSGYIMTAEVIKPSEQAAPQDR